MVEDDLSMVFNDSVTKDIKFRHSIGNYTNFKNIAKYVFEHIAQYISIHNLVSFINANNKTKISYNTIARYLEWMQEALLLYKCQVYNFVEKKVLQTTSKYYSVDTGIRNSESKFKNINSGFQLENVIYLELKRRGYEVHVGKLRNGEIDFVAEKSKETLFIQVTEKIDWDQVTEKIDWDEKSKNYKREIGTLEVIKINEPKIVLSLFDLTQKTNTGIKVMNVIDWLLEKE
jgi:predicted AAA+ superfamily ATPase